MDVQHKQIIIAKGLLPKPKDKGEKWSAFDIAELYFVIILVFGFVRTESGASGHSVALSGGRR